MTHRDKAAREEMAHLIAVSLRASAAPAALAYRTVVADGDKVYVRTVDGRCMAVIVIPIPPEDFERIAR